VRLCGAGGRRRTQDPADYELMRRAMAKGWKPHVCGFAVPNRKSDWKMFGTFGEFPNAQWEYPNASYSRQQVYMPLSLSLSLSRSLSLSLSLVRPLSPVHFSPLSCLVHGFVRWCVV
jgi:hypothetical protein